MNINFDFEAPLTFTFLDLDRLSNCNLLIGSNLGPDKVDKRFSLKELRIFNSQLSVSDLRFNRLRTLPPQLPNLIAIFKFLTTDFKEEVRNRNSYNSLTQPYFIKYDYSIRNDLRIGYYHDYSSFTYNSQMGKFHIGAYSYLNINILNVLQPHYNDHNMEFDI